MDTIQLFVTLEDGSRLTEIKHAISKLRGVLTVNTEEELTFNDTTLEAIQDAREGRTIHCDNFEDYLRKTR